MLHDEKCTRFQSSIVLVIHQNINQKPSACRHDSAGSSADVLEIQKSWQLVDFDSQKLDIRELWSKLQTVVAGVFPLGLQYEKGSPTTA